MVELNNSLVIRSQEASAYRILVILIHRDIVLKVLSPLKMIALAKKDDILGTLFCEIVNPFSEVHH